MTLASTFGAARAQSTQQSNCCESVTYQNRMIPVTHKVEEVGDPCCCCKTRPVAHRKKSTASKQAPTPSPPLPVKPIEIAVDPVHVDPITVNPIDVNVTVGFKGYHLVADEEDDGEEDTVAVKPPKPTPNAAIIGFSGPHRVWRGESAMLTFNTIGDGSPAITGSDFHGIANTVTISSETSASTSPIYGKSRFTLSLTDNVTGLVTTRSVVVKRRYTVMHSVWIGAVSAVGVGTITYFATGANHHSSGGSGGNGGTTGPTTGTGGPGNVQTIFRVANPNPPSGVSPVKTYQSMNGQSVEYAPL